MTRWILRSAILAMCLACAASPAGAQATHEHTGTHTHEAHVHLLHFTHPLVAESVSPDTKARIDYAHRRHTNETDLELEGEYAFAPTFSIEVGLEYDQQESQFAHLHVAPKLANFRWREQLLLVGYGVTFGAPLAEGEPFDVEPFVNTGIKRGDWELEGWAKLTHTFATSDEEAANALGFNAVALLHASARVQPVLELDGVVQVGSAAIEDGTHITPSVRVVPVAGSGLALAAGVSLAISGDSDQATIALSAFFHF